MNAGKLTNKGKRWTKKEAIIELNRIGGLIQVWIGA